MNMTDILAQTGGLQSMARELGISEAEATRGAAALAPMILGGFKKEAQTQATGVEELGGLLGQLGGGDYGARDAARFVTEALVSP